jgi:hypothetical protein
MSCQLKKPSAYRASLLKNQDQSSDLRPRAFHLHTAPLRAGTPCLYQSRVAHRLMVRAQLPLSAAISLFRLKALLFCLTCSSQNPHSHIETFRVPTPALVGSSKVGLLVVLQKSWSISYTKMSSLQVTSAAEAVSAAKLREEASTILETTNTLLAKT